MLFPAVLHGRPALTLPVLPAAYKWFFALPSRAPLAVDFPESIAPEQVEALQSVLGGGGSSSKAANGTAPMDEEQVRAGQPRVVLRCIGHTPACCDAAGSLPVTMAAAVLLWAACYDVGVCRQLAATQQEQPALLRGLPCV